MFDFKKKGWFSGLAQVLKKPMIDESMWEELLDCLIMADVGLSTSERLIQEVKSERPTSSEEVRSALRKKMVNLLSIDRARKGNFPKAIVMVGVNGSGKTTTCAKLAYKFRKEGKKVILTCADTFRAGAAEQLKSWGDKLDIRTISQRPGGDPGAVVFDALKSAQEKSYDVTIIDTAGRLHTKFNLMEELKKINRVAEREAPHTQKETLLILDATTGQNGLSQARHFTQALRISGIILTKLDSSAKGGIVLSIVSELETPLLYVGVGERVEDLLPFDPQLFACAIL
jgi:fused signal recognition particle receptor